MNSIIKRLGMCIAFLLTYFTSFAYKFEADGYYFNITDATNHEVEVTYKNTNYKSYSGVIDIPSSVKYNDITYTVTAIGNSAFRNCGTLPSVKIPNTVKIIGDYAFYECDIIYSLTVGSNVQSIGTSAFYKYYDYYNNSNNKLIPINKAIWLCNTLPSGVSYLYNNSIKYHMSVSKNYVSNDQLELSNQEVYPFLSSQFEVDNVLYVPVSPSDRTCDVIDCNYAPSDGDIVIDSIVSNRGVQLKVLQFNDYAFYNNDSITSLKISNAGNIGEYAFYNCDALTSVTASNNGDIGEQAFYNCDALISVTASNNGYIGSQAFYDCDALTTVTASNNGDIGEQAFYNCDALTSVTASNNGYIGEQAFYDCDALTTVTASNKGSIEKQAFYDCDALTTVTASNNGDIGEKAFYSCDALTTANILNLGSVGDYSFAYCYSLKEVTFGDKVTSLGSYSFQNCTWLPKVEIPDNISSLDSYVFSGCSSLKEVKIGAGISTIPGCAFQNCRSLTDIRIPINIYQINNYAFSGCKSLSDVTIDKYQNEPQYFDDWTGNANDSKEYEIDVKAGDVLSFSLVSNSDWVGLGYYLYAYIDGENVARTYWYNAIVYTKGFSEDKKITLKITTDNNYGGITNLGLNIAPLTLGSNDSSPLFASCPLDEVYIGKKLSYSTSSSSGYSPFYRNTSLRSVKITDAETHIYDNEFYGCSNLQEFECGDGVETIGNWAFSGCSSLKSYSFGTNVKTIGQEAFSDCTAMTSFTTLAAEPPVCGSQALDDINKWECTLHVPAESIDEYQTADQWKEFFFIEASGVEDVIADTATIEIKVNGSDIMVNGADGQPLQVYSIDGRLCASYRTYAGESITLAKGCYIIKAANKTAKIII